MPGTVAYTLVCVPVSRTCAYPEKHKPTIHRTEFYSHANLAHRLQRKIIFPAMLTLHAAPRNAGLSWKGFQPAFLGRSGEPFTHCRRYHLPKFSLGDAHRRQMSARFVPANNFRLNAATVSGRTLLLDLLAQ